MAKKNIEIEEVPVLTEEENEKSPLWYKTGVWCSVAAIAGVAAAALYEIYKSSKESPAPSVDLFKAPIQPVIPHVEPVEEPVRVEEVKEEVVEEPKAEVLEKAAPVKKETPAPKKASAPKKAPAANEGKFVANSKSMVYHTLDCRYSKR
ncbi:MAG: hypothetical protein IJ547_05390, partial [Clostridia bacterium]|nr:hypothetical protein [Clostridia bacterium]